MGDLTQNPMMAAMLMQMLNGNQGGSIWGNQSSMGSLFPLLMGLAGQGGAINSPFQNTGSNWLSQILGMTGNTIGQTGGTASPQGTPNYATPQQSGGNPLLALLQSLGVTMGSPPQQGGGPRQAGMISNNSYETGATVPVMNGLRMPSDIDPWASGAGYSQEEAWDRNHGMPGSPYAVFNNPWRGQDQEYAARLRAAGIDPNTPTAINATGLPGSGRIAGALGLTQGGGGTAPAAGGGGNGVMDLLNNFNFNNKTGNFNVSAFNQQVNPGAGGGNAQPTGNTINDLFNRQRAAQAAGGAAAPNTFAPINNNWVAPTNPGYKNSPQYQNDPAVRQFYDAPLTQTLTEGGRLPSGTGRLNPALYR